MENEKISTFASIFSFALLFLSIYLVEKYSERKSLWEELQLFGINGFATPKPTKLIEHIIKIAASSDSITAERVERVIRGCGKGKNAVEGTDGDLSLYDLGEPLLIGENLNEAVGTEKYGSMCGLWRQGLPAFPKKAAIRDS